MIIWLFTDEFATMGSTQEEEYEEIEELFRQMLPGEKLLFERNKRPSQLANGSADVYVFDIGGMCYVDHSGERRKSWCHDVLRQVEDRPNTLFVPWTSMTGDYLRYVLQEMLPEWDDPDAELPEPKAPPNVWLPPKNVGFDWYKLPGLEEKLQSWVP
jgi:hypothetical protein